MTGNKIQVGVCFGGRSGEHEVSLQSARSVLDNLDINRYEITQIAITHNGQWFSGANAWDQLNKGSVEGLERVILLAEPGDHFLYKVTEVDGIFQLEKKVELDVIIPVLHGTFGEDGTLQGFFELNGIAYVGAGVLGSSVGMDKGLFKEVMRAQGLPVLDWATFDRYQIENDIENAIQAAEKISSYPLFAKPSNLGSSVGVTKCRTRSDLMEGMMEAGRYDRRILIEQGLQNPREIEVSVLGNEQPEASCTGEIIPGEDFYTYSAKYISDNSQLLIPAPLPEDVANEIRRVAIQAYKAIDCAGMARVDFLLDRQTLKIYLSEVNTIPGFTKISMYPKLWEASGLPYSALLDRLIDLALERKSDRDSTEFVYRRNG
jgi:D-alanine-D-alanine ligase